MSDQQERLLWALFTKLRRYKFPLGPEDYESLRLALRAGFGWKSPDDLRKLCASLWAKSIEEQDVVFALFDQLVESSSIEFLWTLDRPSEGAAKNLDEEREINKDVDIPQSSQDPQDKPQLELESNQGLPAITIDPADIPRRPLVFLPQYPVSHRDVAQAFRRLRRPVRKGPKVVLDINATIEAGGRRGIIYPVVMVPRRINTFRLVLLVDRFGSMLPFHTFIDQVVLSVIHAARLESVLTFYFHDVPVVGGAYSLLRPYITNNLMPTVDEVLSDIQPVYKGQLYTDSDLRNPEDLMDILEDVVSGSLVVIISDGGAARGNYDPARLIDTIAFAKALNSYTRDFVWLNPLEQRYWKNSTAEQIARHLPMFTLDAAGMHQAVNVLRGQPYFVEKPL